LNDILNTLIRDKQPPEVLAGVHLTAKPLTSHPPTEAESSPKSTADAQCAPLRDIKGLDADSALEAMGGFVDVYLNAVRLTVRMLPIRIEKMDRFIKTDTKLFTTEVHGLKSSLRIIGAAALGNSAAKLETAAIEGDMAYCFENYPLFRDGLVELDNSLNAALSEFSEEVAVKKAGTHCAPLRDMARAKEAAEIFDRDLALTIISPHADFTYDEKTDELLREIIDSLEAFDCESALKKLIDLEVILNETV
jgi:HPt (histidine-containing phosphotransfer) domain-containing protein